MVAWRAAELANDSMMRRLARVVGKPEGKDVPPLQVRNENAALRAENERLRAKDMAAAAELAKLRAENERLRAENAAKDAEIERQRAEIATLRTKAAEPWKTPRNSSIPPSRGEKADGGARSARPKPRGRKGAHRPLCETPTRVENVLVETCPHCAADVSAAPQEAVETYDHVEIPPIVPDVTRVVLHGGTCPCCSGKFKAEPPEGREPGNMFGPNLVALVLLLRHVGFVSFERLVMMLRCLFSVTVSEGGLANMLRRQVKAFAAQQERIRQDVLKERQIQSDETTMRVGKKRWQQWVFHNGLSCCFIAAASRTKHVVEAFLDGVRPEIWVSDRLGSQMGWARLHQVCLAHLLRTCQHVIDSGDILFAWQVAALLRRAIRHHRMRDRIIRRLGPGAPAAFRHRINAAMDDLLRDEPTHPAAQKLRRSLVKARDHLFVFLDHPEVPPTNNGSERALRPGVIFRKATNCFRSEWAAHLHCGVRSVLETGRRRGIGALDAILLTMAGKPLPIPA
jgi:transposase